MFIAIDDKTGQFVDAAIVEKSNSTYHCPLCNMKVILKKGKVKCSHFAHEKGEDCDSDFKTPDMSEWHRTRQSLFPESCQEVVIKDNQTGEKHRADVMLYNKYIIEFQHSKIGAEEFERRNMFYDRCGYKVIWVFDLSEVSHRLEPWYYKNGTKYKWKYPWHIWDNWDLSDGDLIILIELENHTREELYKKRCWERVGEGEKVQSYKEFWAYKYELSNRMAFNSSDELDKLTTKCQQCGRLPHKYKFRNELKFYYKCYHGKYDRND